ncbi:dihydrolipoyl dehydrogenase [Blattabacterium cuenoti]|uniref:dihydrolipoyl dehydrogenase n=1 Tax=Blattabacterium cuenoti TaxID=1653831 RepID=UPI00163C7C48|nr:dihydrolipoyl dehydrogenase [Blattabacterium cuenoti]
MHFDVIILGSGPGGYVASIRSSQLGLKTAIIEKNFIGGISYNYGCVPIKFILNKIKILQLIKKNPNLFGINYDNFNIDYSKIILESNNIIKKIKNNIFSLIKKNKIHVIYGKAKLKNRKTIEVIQNNNKNLEFYAKNIVISTGLTHNLKKNLYDGKRIITYKEAFSLYNKNLKKIIIIGSDYIGIELACFYHFMGIKIIIVESNPKIFSNGDYEISNYLNNYFKKIGINIYVSSSIISINRTNNKTFVILKVKENNNPIKLESDMVIYSDQMIPNTKFLGLEDIGIQTDNGYIVVNENYQTNIPGYYAIGDVINTPPLASVAMREAINCIEYIKGLYPQKIDYNNIPKCILSYPEIASIGYTEEESIKNGYKVKISKYSFNSLNSKIITGTNSNGFIKIIFDAKYDELLGCHIIGENVINIISEIMIARKLETTAYEILNSIHPHPSLNESISESISMIYGNNPIHYI